MGGTGCHDTPKDGRGFGNAVKLTQKEMYDTLVEMIDPVNQPAPKPTPTIELFDLSASGNPPSSRLNCTVARACVAGSEVSNCKMSKKVDFEPGAGDPKAANYIRELVTQQGAFKGNGVYTMEDAGACDEVWVSRSEVGGDCRVTGLRRDLISDSYWQTRWKLGGVSGAGNNIVVKYTMSADPDGKSAATSARLFQDHGAEGDDDGWNSMLSTKNDKPDRRYHLKWWLIARSAINSLRVRSMVLKRNGATYTLAGAHRLNFNYHRSDEADFKNTRQQWGRGTFPDEEMLARMKDYGLATNKLFDPLGFVWLLLWTTAETVLTPAKYYVCAAQMHPHFADLLTGFLPENYNACTATRWWTGPTPDTKTWYFNNGLDPSNHDPKAIRKEMGLENTGTGDRTYWVADKIRKPFFTLELDGAVYDSDDIIKAMAGGGATKQPIEKLVEALKHIYFGYDPAETAKPAAPAATPRPTAVVVFVGAASSAASAAAAAAASSAAAAEDAADKSKASADAATAAAAANPGPEAAAAAVAASAVAATAKADAETARARAAVAAKDDADAAAAVAAKAKTDAEAKAATAAAKAKTDAEAKAKTDAATAVTTTPAPVVEETMMAKVDKYKWIIIAVLILVVGGIVLAIVLSSRGSRSNDVTNDLTTDDASGAGAGADDSESP